MESLLAPLEELTKDEISPEYLSTHMDIPSPDFLKKEHGILPRTGEKPKGLTKYEKEYDLFCRWSALPKSERNPKTAVDWEKQYLLPKGYSNYFKGRDDYRDKTLNYFWEWMMDELPNVVFAVYKRAIKNSPKDAAMFIDLIGKRMNLDKPQSVIQPLMLVGVDQNKIDKLFVAKGYEEVKDITPRGGA